MRLRVAAVAVLGLCAAACSALPRNGVPPALVGSATIPGMADIRAAAGQTSDAMMADFARSFEQESAEDFPVGPDGIVHYAHVALSGGGASGAFGAGFVNGLDRIRHEARVQDRNGRVHGRPDGPFPFSRAGV
jgi:hypothetical protein